MMIVLELRHLFMPSPVFVNVVAAWFWFMLRCAPGRPWGRRRQLHGVRVGGPMAFVPGF